MTLLDRLITYDATPIGVVGARVSFLSSLLRELTVSSLPWVRVPSVGPESSAGEVRRVMRNSGARIVAVVTERGRLLGVIHRSRVVVATVSRKSEAVAKDLMEDPLVIVPPTDNSEVALRKLLGVGEWYAPVVERGLLKGFIGLESFILLALDRTPRGLEGVYADEIMTRDVVYVDPEDPISKVWRLMTEKLYAGFPVAREDRKLVGIITQHDILKRGYTRIELESSAGPKEGPRVRDAMNPDPIYALPWSSVREIARVMMTRGIGRIPVVESKEDRRLIGIIDREDIARLVLGG